MMKRIDLNGGGCRAVVSGGIAYFTGHVAQGPDLTSQMKALGRRYEELFAINGLKKDPYRLWLRMSLRHCSQG